MSMGLEPLAHPLDGRMQFLARGPSFDGRASLSVSFPAKFKSQEIKPPIVPPAIPAKANRLRLVRGQFHAVLCQPLKKCPLKCRRFVPILEAPYKVVRKAEQPALASIVLPH